MRAHARTRLIAIATSGALALLATAASAQPRAPQDNQESRLKAAIIEEPGDLNRYLRLADHYQRLGKTNQADRVLRDALGIDPSSRLVHERRVLLYAVPFNYAMLPGIAQTWFSVDATNPVPVLLTAGNRLRLASAQRGDGTSGSMDLLDEAMRDVEGAVPANPTNRGLAAARVRLLLAKAALSTGAEAERLLGDAQAAQRVEDELANREQSIDAIPTALAPVVTAAWRPVPFGPPGAVRAGSLVPRPRVITRVPIARRPVQPERPRVIPLAVEVVISVEGKVIQVSPLGSTEGFDETVAEALSQWVFEPTRLNGQPVMVIDTVAVTR